ncbi:MAG TPA: methyltransferase domain-containing protein [Beijerinckiaceae bacterium]|nr:methyltransferase domain-containing protein [Beijerinckiaceae bacterium]
MKGIDFSRRSDAAELMDDGTTDFDTFKACLVDLAKVNRLTFTYRPTLDFFDRLARSGALPQDRPLSVLDVGSGYGDMLRKIDRWAMRRGVPASLVGVDLNPWSARAAREATPPGRPIEWITANVFEYRPTAPIDVIVSSLFAHHLDDADVVRFVAWMNSNAQIGWFVNDLHRHPIAYHAFRATSRALNFHHFVQHDGPVSILRAFAVSDWRRSLGAAGLAPDAVAVKRRFPFRICVTRAPIG